MLEIGWIVDKLINVCVCNFCKDDLTNEGLGANICNHLRSSEITNLR